MHSPHSLVDTILVAACLGAGRPGYCELGTGEYGSIVYSVLYKLHVMDTFVCGSFFLSCFYVYDTFGHYEQLLL